MSAEVGSASGVRGERLTGVHALRGLAAIAVLIHHALEELSPVLGSGPVLHVATLATASGVDIFFVISGFIMMQTSARRAGVPGAARDFLVRRFIRVLPLYWIATILIVALAATGALYRSLKLSGDGVALSLALLPTQNLVLGVGWTLQYEMYFYLVFALALMVAQPRSLLVWMGGLLATVAIAAAFLPPSTARTFYTNPIVIEFVFGMAVATAHRAGWFNNSRAPGFAGLGAIGLMLASSVLPSIGTGGLAPTVRFAGWGLPAATLLIAALAVTIERGFAARVCAWAGDTSYALYLFHGFIMTALGKAVATGFVPQSLSAGLVAFSVAIAASLCLADLVHRAIETPIDRRLRSIWAKFHQRRAGLDGDATNSARVPATVSR